MVPCLTGQPILWATALVIRILEIGLFAGFILHIIQGYVVEAKNRSKRNKGYAK